MRLIFDIEANGLLKADDFKKIPAATKVWCICAYDLDTGHEYRFDPDELPQGLKLLDQADLLIGHNIQEYDLPLLEKLLNWKRPDCQVYDTLIVSRLWWTHLSVLDGRVRDRGEYLPAELFGRHSLEAWGYRLKERKGEYSKTEDAFASYQPELLDYCAQDVQVTLKLWDLMQRQQIPSLAVGIEHRFAHAIQSVMDAGVNFDKKKAEALERDLAMEQARLVQELRNLFPPRVEVMKTPQYWEVGGIRWDVKSGPSNALLKRSNGKWSWDHNSPEFKTRKEGEEWIKANMVAGPPKEKLHPFNPRSASDVARNFTEKYDWKPKAFGKDGIPTMDEGVLKSLPFPEAKQLLALAIVNKRLQMLSSGKTPYLGAIRPDGRIYGYINHNGTQTHRCTHSNPNLGQVPKRDKDPIYGDRFRELFIPRENWWLMGADLSGLEIRCLANRLNNRTFTETVLEGDIHAMNQEALGFDSRSKTKNWFYAYLYGAGDAKLGKMAGGTKKDGTALRAQFEDRIPGLGTFVKKVKMQALSGYLTAIDGRRIPIRSDHSALNFQLQADGAIASKVATMRFFDEASKASPPGRYWNMVLHVHDEFQVEVKNPLLEKFMKIALACFPWAGEYLGFTLPLAGEVAVGHSWKETH